MSLDQPLTPEQRDEAIRRLEAMKFPCPQRIGQIWSGPDGCDYRWDGSDWKLSKAMEISNSIRPNPPKESALHDAALEHLGGIIQEMRERSTTEYWLPFWKTWTGAMIRLAAIVWATCAVYDVVLHWLWTR
jgi:hypothetical protein